MKIQELKITKSKISPTTFIDGAVVGTEDAELVLANKINELVRKANKGKEDISGSEPEKHQQEAPQRRPKTDRPFNPRRV